MRVTGIQHNIIWEDPAANAKQLAPLIDKAAADGADLVVLPEMFAYGFSMGAAELAEDPSGPTVSFLVEQAAKHDIAICGSIPITATEPGDHPTNQLVVADPSGVIGRYDKIHPFSFAGEHEHYGPGSDFLQLSIGGVRCSFFICYDLRFSNEFWGLANDTDLFVVVANWPAVRRMHWSALLQARAIENQCYVLGVNRVGDDANGHAYSGDSALIDSQGNTIAEASEVPTFISGDVEADAVSATRLRFPFLPDRR